MIPKDLLNLIERYNEYGIYFCLKKSVYWFNAKRIEVFKNQTPYYIEETNIHKCFNEHTRLTYDYSSAKVFVANLGNIFLPHKELVHSGYRLLSFGNYLYYFGTIKNEKFDVFKLTWSEFKHFGAGRGHINYPNPMEVSGLTWSFNRIGGGATEEKEEAVVFFL